MNRNQVLKLLHENNLNCIPIKPKSKIPLLCWSEYQSKKFTSKISRDDNLGIICGISSDNLVVLDVDDNSLLEYFEEFLSQTLVVKTRDGFHIYFKAEKIPNTLRLENKNGFVFSPNVLILGDMNVPTMKKDDEVFKQLNNKTFTAVDYTDYLTPYSNIKNDMTFDQLVIAEPFAQKMTLKKYGIFAWDNTVFAKLWKDLEKENKRTAAKKFQAYAKWAISDHRPLWCLFEFNGD